MFQLKWNKNAVPSKTLKRKLPGTDEEEKRNKNKRYEEHRPERKLNTKWQEGRPWLQFNLEENSMTCSICMDYYRGKEMPINNLKGQNRFLSGCTNRKISASLQIVVKIQVYAANNLFSVYFLLFKFVCLFVALLLYNIAVFSFISALFFSVLHSY
jgi:hypothetical protein